MEKYMKSCLIFLLIVLLSITLYFLHAVHFKLWYDEAVQLSISHLANPETLQVYSYKIDYSSVIHFNQKFNMDPGGYSLLLNTLSPIVKNHFYVYRLVNIVFFVIGCILLFLLVMRRSSQKSVLNALLLTSGYLIFFTFLLSKNLYATDGVFVLGKKGVLSHFPYTPLLKYSFYIRSYSLQFFLIAAILFQREWFMKNQPFRNIAITFIFMAGILLTRYDFSIFVVCYFLAAIIYAYANNALLELVNTRWIWLSGLCIVSCFGLVYFYSYTKQLGGSSVPYMLPYLDHLSLDKFKNWIIYMKDSRNLASWAILIFIMYRYYYLKRVDFLEILYVSVFICYFLLSILGFYPYSFSSNRCTSMIIVMDTVIFHLAIVMCTRIWGRMKHLQLSSMLLSNRLSKAYCIVIIAYCSYVIMKEFKTHGSKSFANTMTSDNKPTDAFLSSVSGKRIFVDYMYTPILNCYFTMLNKPLPANKYYCELLGPHSYTHRANPSKLDRFNKVIEYECDYYFMKSLLNAKTIKSLYTLGFQKMHGFSYIYYKAGK